MAASSLLAHATRFLAVVLVARSLAACANDQNPADRNSPARTAR